MIHLVPESGRSGRSRRRQRLRRQQRVREAEDRRRAPQGSTSRGAGLASWADMYPSGVHRMVPSGLCPAADRSRPLSGGKVVPDEPPALASCSRMPGSDIWKATHRSTASGRRLICLGSHDIDIDLQCPRCRPRGRAHDRPRALRERRLTTIYITGPSHGGERLPTGDAAGRERGGRLEVVARRGDVSVVVRS
jgi:hypothetical protein